MTTTIGDFYRALGFGPSEIGYALHHMTPNDKRGCRSFAGGLVAFESNVETAQRRFTPEKNAGRFASAYEAASATRRIAPLAVENAVALRE